MPRTTRQETIRKMESINNHLEAVKMTWFEIGKTYQDANAATVGVALVEMDMCDELIRLTNQAITELKGG